MSSFSIARKDPGFDHRHRPFRLRFSGFISMGKQMQVLIVLLVAIAIGLQWSENISSHVSLAWNDFRLFVGAILFFCALALYAYLDTRKPTNSPPGPPWLPFVGSSRYLQGMCRKFGSLHEAFAAIAQEHQSPIFCLKLGGRQVVVITSFELIHELLTREVFEARPDNFFIRLRTMGKLKGVSFVSGEFWKEQRSFVVRTLRQLGVGKSKMEQEIVEEVQGVVDQLRTSPRDTGVCVGPLITLSMVNVLWVLIAGHRFSKSDDRLKRIVDFIKSRGKAFDMAGGVLNQFPWLRYVAPERSGYNLMLKLNDEWNQLLTETINEHQEHYSPNVTKDVIDAFLHEMKARKEETESNYTMEQLIMICLDLFVAGTGTTGGVLDFAILMMVVHPDMQCLVHEELDRVIGRDRIPELGDQGSLPYVEAVLLEVQRVYYVLPVSSTRRALWDTTLHGYNIPKGTNILPNMWSVLMNEAHWGDPKTFRPTRFLDSAGQLKMDKCFLPFSVGRRRCLGDTLAKASIFMFFVGLMQKFRVLPVEGEMPSTIPLSGISLTPRTYNAVFEPRF